MRPKTVQFPTLATGAGGKGVLRAGLICPSKGATALNPDFLVTHSGGFHADELLSSAVLTRLFPQAQLIRTREATWLAPAGDRIIYDVGAAYDPPAGIFDHHQRGAPLRDSGEPFSSFGLIWKHFGQDYLRALGVPEAHLAEIHTEFDQDFVLPIDLMDNGALSASVAGPLGELTLPALIDSLKPPFDQSDKASEDRAFRAALEMLGQFIAGNIARRAAKLRAEDMVFAAIKAAGSGRVLELPQGMPFRSALAKAGADHLLFVVHPRDKDWCLAGIPLVQGEFKLRADLPAAWAGLTNGDLEAVCGVAGASFCHNGRFIAAARSREAILAMAQIAVREACPA